MLRNLILVVVVLALVSSSLAFFRHKDKMHAESKDGQKKVVEPGIRSWAHLEGVHFAEARDAILKDRPGLNVVRLPQNAAVTMDYREDRVRIFVDEDGKVVGRPLVG